MPYFSKNEIWTDYTDGITIKLIKKDEKSATIKVTGIDELRPD